MSKAYVALGSNIEPRQAFLKKAIEVISARSGITLKKASSIYNTYPLGCPLKSRFLNRVIEIETVLRPESLLAELLNIERSLGRERSVKNFPRTIDLDILFYDDLVTDEEGLVIPHPEWEKRDFLILGMNEIAPGIVHPVLNKSVSDIHNGRPMKIIKKAEEAYRYIDSLKSKGKRVGIVPTMGFLHEGHLSLMRRARRENDVVVVSVFVNPAQFGPREDFDDYPRDLKRDKRLMKQAGVDVVFLPETSRMYAAGHSTFINVDGTSERLCGRYRPGHFKGVATIVTKLFNIIPAHNAYFGQKDAQQAFMIRRLVGDLNIPVKIRILPIVRESDGLAMSSRNAYLSKSQRREAAVLYKSLLSAKGSIEKGEKRANAIIEKTKKSIEENSSGKVQYISVVSTKDLKDVKILKREEILIALAVYFGKTRLIDNITVTV
ncbi:MAG: pantoate--beta-alanine ligase [Candidatus Omnitrophica bacterium]|nr:pantoate--beta-alanine ligase [Candidatus Omnitrophota bacterium]